MSTIRPPFSLETATAKVRAAEDAWNSRDPQRKFRWSAPGPRPEDDAGIAAVV